MNASVKNPQERFLSAFRGESQANVKEFGKQLWEMDSDVFIFMARKAACFFDCLRELKIAEVRGLAVSDRILDMDVSFLKGKRVTLVDDCVFSGTSLFHARNIVAKAGASYCNTMALSINKDWIRPALLPEGNEGDHLNFVEPLFKLADSQCVQQCYDIVRAISIFPRPYDVDFPHTLTSKLSQGNFDRLLHCVGWNSFDVSTNYQVANDVRAFTVIPDEHIKRLFAEAHPGLAENIQVAKVRIYARRLSAENWSVRMVPMVVLGALQVDVIEANGAIWGDAIEHAARELGADSAKSRFRLLHFIISWALLKQYSDQLRTHCNLHITEEIRTDLAEMTFGSRFPVFWTKAVGIFEDVSLPEPIVEPDSSTISKFGDEVVEANDPQELVSACLAPFSWLYRNLELPARQLVRDFGLNACLDPINKDLIRLQRGFSARRLISRLSSKTFDVTQYVSLFLDKAIDLGIAVPTIVHDGDVLYRAFRHGEDAVFGEAEERLSLIALQAYLDSKNLSSVYGLELQKFIVLFIQIAVRDGDLLERLSTSESVNVGCRIVSIKGHLHGPVPMVTTLDESGTVGAPYVEGNDYKIEWLIKDWERKGILRVEKSGSAPFVADELKDVFKFATRLKHQSDSISADLYARLSAEVRNVLDGWDGIVSLPENFASLLAEELNRIANAELIWHSARFQHVRLRSVTERQVKSGKKVTDASLSRVNRLLLEDAFPEEFVRAKRGTRYFIRKMPELAIGMRKESLARKIGRCLGRLVGDGHARGEKPLNNDTDLVLLSTCSEADHQVRALSGELAIIVERWILTMSQVRERARTGDFMGASRLLTSINDLFVAANSGAMKYRWYVGQVLQTRIQDVADFAKRVDPQGDLSDDWTLMWPESVFSGQTGTAPSVRAHISSMGQWLIATNVALRVFNYWLVRSAELKQQGPAKDTRDTLDDCLKWCDVFLEFCSDLTKTSFGNMVKQLRHSAETQDIEVVGDQCRLAADFIREEGRRAMRRLQSDATLLCDGYGAVGEFRPYQYAVFLDIEPLNSSQDPYSKLLRITGALIDDDARLIEKNHNPWRSGLWVLLRGNRSSTSGVDLCLEFAKRCLADGLRFRAVVLGQLSYDDGVRDMAGSTKMAHGDFFRRIAQLRLSILPQGYKNCVTLVNEVTGSRTTEGEKFRAIAKLGSLVPEIIQSTGEDLPEKKFSVTKVLMSPQGQVAPSRTPPARSTGFQSGRDLTPKDVLGKVVVGIITIREDEFEAVLHRFPERRLVLGSNTYYQYAEIETQSGDAIGVAIARSPEQGSGPAQALADSMIRELGPQWIFVVGIAGSFPASEFTLGDVLLSQRMHDFAVGAAIEGKPPEFQDMGGAMAVAVEKLVTGLKGLRTRLGTWNNEATIGMVRPQLKVPADISSDELYGGEQWKTKVLNVLREHFPDGKVRPPEFFSAVIISSNTLVKDTTIAEQWRQNARQAAGVEMELAGVCRAARYGTDGQTKVLAIRGLSDIVGYKRSTEWTLYACNSAAAFAAALIESGLILLDS